MEERWIKVIKAVSFDFWWRFSSPHTRFEQSTTFQLNCAWISFWECVCVCVLNPKLAFEQIATKNCAYIGTEMRLCISRTVKFQRRYFTAIALHIFQIHTRTNLGCTQLRCTRTVWSTSSLSHYHHHYYHYYHYWISIQDRPLYARECESFLWELNFFCCIFGLLELDLYVRHTGK